MVNRSLPLIVIVSVIFIGAILLLGNLKVIPQTVVALWPLVLIVGGLVGLICCGPITSRSASKRKK